MQLAAYCKTIDGKPVENAFYLIACLKTDWFNDMKIDSYEHPSNSVVLVSKGRENEQAKSLFK